MYWTLLAIGLSLLSGCSKQPPQETPRPQPTPTVAPTDTKPQPALLAIETVNATPADSAPEGAALNPKAALEEAAFAPGAFRRSEPDATDGCRLTASLIAVLTSNKKTVPKAKQGEARAGLLAELHCREAEEVTSLRAEVERVVPFQAQDNVDGGQAHERAVGEACQALIHQLVGQHVMRGADDKAVLQTLEVSTHVGELMEAALAAGERKLVKARASLVRLIAHPHPTVTMRAAAALGQLKIATQDVVDALVSMTRGADIEKHFVAINALGDLKSPLAVKYLQALADGHPEEAIRNLAREAATRSADNTPGTNREVAP